MPGPDRDAGANGLFSAYVDEWLRLKVEASGWPVGCDGAEQRDAYLREWEEREGIRLRRDHIAANPGLRKVAVGVLGGRWWGGEGCNILNWHFLYFFEKHSGSTKNLNGHNLYRDNILAPQRIIQKNRTFTEIHAQFPVGQAGTTARG